MTALLVHQHVIVRACVDRAPDSIRIAELETFLMDLVDALGMTRLFEPIALKGKFGFTGMVGIVTSHIAFHYFDADASLQLDVYSCKEFDREAVVSLVNGFWRIRSAWCIEIRREEGGGQIRQYGYGLGGEARE